MNLLKKLLAVDRDRHLAFDAECVLGHGPRRGLRVTRRDGVAGRGVCTAGAEDLDPRHPPVVPVTRTRYRVAANVLRMTALLSSLTWAMET